MTITKRKGGLPHIEWIDLKGNGVLSECAVLKEDGFGNTYYLEVPNLDMIDKTRLARILQSRKADDYELWDIMSQVTLNNGLNALEYFHQLVKVITPDGVIMNPRAGTVGTGTVNTNSVEDMASMELNNAIVESVAVTEAAPVTLTPAEKRARTIAAKKAAAAPK